MSSNFKQKAQSLKKTILETASKNQQSQQQTCANHHMIMERPQEQ